MSTHVVEQLSFSLFLSFLTFDFGLILGSFLIFWGPKGLFFGLGKGSNTYFGSTHVVEQLSSSMFPSILSFDFDLILGHCHSLVLILILISIKNRIDNMVGQNTPPTTRNSTLLNIAQTI